VTSRSYSVAATTAAGTAVGGVGGRYYNATTMAHDGRSMSRLTENNPSPGLGEHIVRRVVKNKKLTSDDLDKIAQLQPGPRRVPNSFRFTFERPESSNQWCVSAYIITHRTRKGTKQSPHPRVQLELHARARIMLIVIDQVWRNRKPSALQQPHTASCESRPSHDGADEAVASHFAKGRQAAT
jgi:hypothetical protein